MDQVRSALIGCGKVGRTHAQAFAALAESNFVALCSRDPAKASAFAHRYGVRAYTDLEATLQAPTVQMVSICTPQHTHSQLATACARAGKHVLVEKPMAVDLSRDIYRHLSLPTGPTINRVPAGRIRGI